MPDNNNFQFYPRPEAHPMEWGELLPPLQNAVRDLLVRLDGAVGKVDQSIAKHEEDKNGEYAASCFLVYGERGTGKTTVLLSANDAVVKKCDDFFKKPTEESEAELNLRENAKKSADKLQRKGLVWLDVLDIESMPLRANLLTTLLTRVRNALCPSNSENITVEHISILEDGADSARHKLDQLIKDATLMWQDIHEPDTREVSNRQIYAADISARYKTQFRDAMMTLSKELGRRNGRRDEYLPIVLPIDNIDRSTDHLYNIVKLAQMVASPYLWLVLAGDREDIESFLERAYWKELISIGEGAGGGGKMGLGGEDEAIGMARRQAAAASHKLLPPSHRIEVQLVKPIDTLHFRAPSMGKSDNGDGQTIYDLLQQVEMSIYGIEAKLTFADLFYAQKFAETQPEAIEMDAVLIEMAHNPGELDIQFIEVIKERKHPKNLEAKYLTLVSRLGLQLPARGVLDLWQLAYWAVNDEYAKNIKVNYIAEKIARTMLRNIIAESRVSNKVGQWLQSKIIGRNSDGATILNFIEPNPSLNVTYRRTWDMELRVDTKSSKEGTDLNYVAQSKLSIRGGMEAILFYLDGSPAKNKKLDNIDKNKNELPYLVAGWLVVLYDIVLWSEKSWVLQNTRAREIMFDIVKVSHEIIRLERQRPCLPKDIKELSWPVPDWNAFFAYDVFQMRWNEFRSAIHEKCDKNNKAYPAQFLPWVLAVGWVACVLDTYEVFYLWTRDDAPHERTNSGRLAASILKTEKWTDDESIKVQEKPVIEAAADWYFRIMNKDKKVNIDMNHERVFFTYERVIFMRNWLEQKLPLLLSHLYVPMDIALASARKQYINKVLDEKNPQGKLLLTAWEANSPFILADIEKKLEDVFPVVSEPDPKQPHSLDDLYGPFADMHKFWQNSNSKSS